MQGERSVDAARGAWYEPRVGGDVGEDRRAEGTAEGEPPPAAGADGVRREARLSLVARLAALGALTGGLVVAGAVLLAAVAFAGLLAIVGLLAPGQQGRALGSGALAGDDGVGYVVAGGLLLPGVGLVVELVAGLSLLARRSVRAQRAAEVARLSTEKRR